jgi:pimeloyl-ACP methyl ester carboxylesterase
MPQDHFGAGPAIILLHGFPFNRSMWREQIDFLSANGYRVVAPDLRGLGENVAQTSVCDSASEDHRLKSLPFTTMEKMARDVAALMDELKIESAVICGLSMGCYVAFEFIHLFPSRVKALILCGPRAQGSNEAEKTSREAQAQRVLLEGMDFAVESISTSLLAEATVKKRPDVVAHATEMVLQTDPRGAAAVQRGMAARRDYSNDLPNIQVPTLIIAGREDGVRTPEDAEFIQRGIKGSQSVMIEEAGHLMNMEQAEKFNKAVVSFLMTLNH